MPEPRVFRQVAYEPPAGSTEVLLVRHGQSEAIAEGASFPLLDGQDDPPLSDEGASQATRVAARLVSEQLVALYVSSLRRTFETASRLARLTGLVPVVDADLREVFLGDWEGGPFRQKMADQDPLALRMQLEERWDVIPGAEPAAELAMRLRRAVARIASAHPDQRVAVFSHGGAIATILAIAATSRPFAFLGADNGSISRIVVTPHQWHLRGFNDTAHLR